MVYGETHRQDGWKLHVSAIPSEATRLLSSLQPLLNDVECFKFARSEVTLGQLNEGAFGPTQVGKFLTVYPRDDNECLRLAEAIIERTEGFSGPIIVTDRRLGSVVYARHGPFHPRTVRNRLGVTSSVAVQENGDVRVQEYSVPHRTPDGVTDIFADWEGPGLPQDSSSGAFGSRFLLIDAVKAAARGSVYLAIDLQAAPPRQVALKEGRQHCNSDADGRDVRFRLRRQLELHALVHPAINVPRAYDYVEIEGNGYLVLEWIEGVDLERFVKAPLGSLPKAEQRDVLSTLLLVLEQVERLHDVGFTHRDLAPSNIMIGSDGRIWLIDLELSHRLGSKDLPFTQGTRGFVSPQQIDGAEPTISDDVYGAGALLAFALTCIDPRRFLETAQVPDPESIKNLALVSPGLSRAIARALSPVPHERGNIADLSKALRMELAAPSPAKRYTSCSPDERLERVHLALCGLSDCMTDERTRLWLSSMSSPSPGALSDYALQRSTNRGVAGVLYAIAKAARVVAIPEPLRRQVDAAVDWLLVHVPTSDDQLPGLHFGEAGVAVALAECRRSRLISDGSWSAGYFDEALQGPLDWPDLTHGAAGQGLAAYICADSLSRPELAQHAKRCFAHLASTQEADGAWSLPEGVAGMSGDKLTGFAHGTAGCIYFLAEHAARIGCLDAKSAALRGAEWLISQSRERGGSLHWPTRSGGDDFWRWWCHGAPGIALTWLRLHELTRETDYAELARSALASVSPHLRYSNLSQCHGLAGIADIEFAAARRLGDEHLERAYEIAETLWALARRTKHGVVWLAEDPNVPTADLMVGSAGCLHVLTNAASPSSASFPLLPERC